MTINQNNQTTHHEACIATTHHEACTVASYGATMRLTVAYKRSRGYIIHETRNKRVRSATSLINDATTHHGRFVASNDVTSYAHRVRLGCTNGHVVRNGCKYDVRQTRNNKSVSNTTTSLMNDATIHHGMHVTYACPVHVKKRPVRRNNNS